MLNANIHLVFVQKQHSFPQIPYGFFKEIGNKDIRPSEDSSTYLCFKHQDNFYFIFRKNINVGLLIVSSQLFNGLSMN